MAQGEVELVESVLDGMGEPLPAAPLLVAVAATEVLGAASLLAVLETVARNARAAGRAFFFAEDDGHVVTLIAAEDQDLVERVASSTDMRFGISNPTGSEAIDRAIRQARLALEAASETSGAIVAFDSVCARGVLSTLADGGAAEIAHALLEPLLVHDGEHGTVLFESGWRWLAANGEFEAAARDLGVHRHTVRARIALTERVLGRDLSGFAARAELWSAYVALGHATP